MTLINAQTIREFGTFVSFIEGFGYLYQVENKLYKYDRNGLTQL